MSDIFWEQKRRTQVMISTCFATMRSQVESVHSTLFSDLVYHRNVCKHVPQIIRIGRVGSWRPEIWIRRVLTEEVIFRLGLVINLNKVLSLEIEIIVTWIKTRNMLKKLCQMWMCLWIYRCLHNWREDVIQEVAKVVDGTVLFENVINSRNLNQPSYVVGINLLLNCPFC